MRTMYAVCFMFILLFLSSASYSPFFPFFFFCFRMVFIPTSTSLIFMFFSFICLMPFQCTSQIYEIYSSLAFNIHLALPFYSILSLFSDFFLFYVLSAQILFFQRTNSTKHTHTQKTISKDKDFHIFHFDYGFAYFVFFFHLISSIAVYISINKTYLMNS